ncbi:MAG: S9 family peptidase, partial [Roseibium sp.]
MTKPLPPRAQARPVTLETHGIQRQDDYAWLRADNWQDVMRDGRDVLDDDIEAYLDAENAYQDAMMAPTKELQETLFAEMRGRI